MVFRGARLPTVLAGPPAPNVPRLSAGGVIHPCVPAGYRPDSPVPGQRPDPCKLNRLLHLHPLKMALRIHLGPGQVKYLMPRSPLDPKHLERFPVPGNLFQAGRGIRVASGTPGAERAGSGTQARRARTRASIPIPRPPKGCARSGGPATRAAVSGRRGHRFESASVRTQNPCDTLPTQ